MGMAAQAWLGTDGKPSQGSLGHGNAGMARFDETSSGLPSPGMTSLARFVEERMGVAGTFNTTSPRSCGASPIHKGVTP